MDKPNEMTFCVENYSDENDMWYDIAKFLKALLKNEYIATVRCEDDRVYVIKYDYDDREMGTPMPFWLTPDEYEELQNAFENLNFRDNCVEKPKEGYEYGL